jgi:GTP-sensing pleiotropic transcriptional regulator CodY
MADSGAMPGSLAGKFTLGQDATLCVIADEYRAHGCCDLSLDEIADKASVGRSALQSALRKARELGLITVKNRGRLTNVVRIIAPEWLAWLQLGDRGRAARRPLQGAFVNDEQQRLLEIEDMRLVVKFGDKKRYSDREYEAIYQELVEAGLKDKAWHDLDAIEAVFKKLNAEDEAETARRDLCG